MPCLTRCSPAWSVRIWCLALVIPRLFLSVGRRSAHSDIHRSLEAIRPCGIQHRHGGGVLYCICNRGHSDPVGHTDHVDLDPNCVLYGQLELLVWFDAPASFGDVGFTDVYHALPSSIWSLLIMVTLFVLFVVICFKELRLVSFDPGLARTLGFSSSAINMVLMLLVSVATVAFEAVGSVSGDCSVACSRLDGSTLHRSSQESDPGQCLVAFGSAILGYLLSTWIPLLGKANL